MKLLSAVTQDSFGVQVILHRDEDEANTNNHTRHLIVNLHQGTVHHKTILLEILNYLLQYGKLVLDVGGHGGLGLCDGVVTGTGDVLYWRY